MPQTKQATAYHEAGHGVVAHRYGHEVGKLTIVPDESRLGFFSGEGAWANGSKDHEQIVVLYAGFAAEQKYDSSAEPGGSASDDEEARHLLQSQPEDTTEEHFRAESKRLVEENWAQIEAVATALLEHETMEGDVDWTIIVDAVDEGVDWRPIFARHLAIVESMRQDR
jgi:ATP-dependent Zn protease